MTLIILTVAVIALLVAAVAISLFALGVLLNRIADNLDQSATSVINISRHATAIGPGVTRLNRSARELADALPLLHDDTDKLIAVSGATTATGASGATEAKTPDPQPVPAESAGVGVGYLDR